MNLQQTIKIAHHIVAKEGAPFKQIKSDDGYLVRVQLTQRRLSNTRQVRLHVWDSTGRLLRKDEIPA